MYFAKKNTDSRICIETAKTIIVGGRGIETADMYANLKKIANGMKAGFGASRGMIDNGLANDTMLIGQSGKTVAPNLYIGVGVSGALQHISGIKDSKVIVAINNDEQAPIFEIADYILVQDANTALNDLIEELK